MQIVYCKIINEREYKILYIIHKDMIHKANMISANEKKRKLD